MKNYYQVLQVVDFCDIEVIKASYKALSKKYHPDLNKNADPKMMIEINLAYEILSNPQKKQNYDQQLRNELNQNKERLIVKEVIKEKKPSSKISSFFHDVIRGFQSSYTSMVNEVENAYLEGKAMSDDELIYRFKKAKTLERNGYGEVLIERGYLKKRRW